MKEKKKTHKIVLGKIEQGTCPYCGSGNIDYQPCEDRDDMVYYHATCCDCKRDFEEWYRLEFVGHNVGTGLDIEASEGMEIDDPLDNEDLLWLWKRLQKGMEIDVPLDDEE